MREKSAAMRWRCAAASVTLRSSPPRGCCAMRILVRSGRAPAISSRSIRSSARSAATAPMQRLPPTSTLVWTTAPTCRRPGATGCANCSWQRRLALATSATLPLPQGERERASQVLRSKQTKQTKQTNNETPMKAAVLHEVNTPLVIEDVSLPKPGPREVLIRTSVAGLCHSDLHFMEGLYPHPLPAVLGHESAGVVEQVGSDVNYVKPGDHVVTC